MVLIPYLEMQIW